MRDFKGIKRQRNRNRNGGGGGGGGGGKPQNNANRAFDSNGPDGVKVRGAAQHVYEKYQQLARDAHTSGDRVLAENHLQHAEHYFRVLRTMQPQRPLADIIGRDQFVSGYDIDFEDETPQVEAAETESEEGEISEGRQGDGRQGDDRGYRDQRSEWRGDDRQDRNQQDRADRQFRGQDRFRDDRPRDDRRDDRPRDDRPRDDRPRDDRPRASQNDRPRYDRPEQRSPDQRNERFEQPRQAYREEEPRPAEPVAPTGPVLRADDGEVNHAPAFLQVRPHETSEGADSDAPRPRRRRAPREVAEAAPVAESEEN